MKKLGLVICLSFSMLLFGCSREENDNNSISESDYEKAIEERNEYESLYEKMSKDYSNAKDLYAELYSEYVDISYKIEEQKNEENTTKKKGDEKEILDNYEYEQPYFSYKGSGDEVVSGLKTDSLSYAYIQHDKEGHFSVRGYFGTGEYDYDLLVNTTEKYKGKTLLYPEREYTFEVNGEGDWTIDVYKMGTSSVDSFSGSGDFVSPAFFKTSDVYEINTKGDSHFSVKGYYGGGEYDCELLVNTTDNDYSGSVMFRCDSEYAFFVIEGEREWEIKPVE